MELTQSAIEYLIKEKCTPEKYYLGSLCKNGHGFGNTGRSIKLKSCHGCLECKRYFLENHRHQNLELYQEYQQKYRHQNPKKISESNKKSYQRGKISKPFFSTRITSKLNKQVEVFLESNNLTKAELLTDALKMYLEFAEDLDSGRDYLLLIKEDAGYKLGSIEDMKEILTLKQQIADLEAKYKMLEDSQKLPTNSLKSPTKKQKTSDQSVAQMSLFG